LELVRRSLTAIMHRLGRRIVVFAVLAVVVGLFGMGLHTSQETRLLLQGEGADFSTGVDVVQSRIGLLVFGLNAFLVVLDAMTVPDFVRDRSIVDHEVGNEYYYTVLYHMASTISTLCHTTLLALLITSVFGLFGLISHSLWEYFRIMLLTLFCGESTGMLVSHILGDASLALPVLLMIHGLSILLQGSVVLPSLLTKGLQSLTNLPFQTHSFHLLIIYEFNLRPAAVPQQHIILDRYNIHALESNWCLVYFALGIHFVSLVVLLCQYISFKKSKLVQPQQCKQERVQNKNQVELELI